MTEVQVIFATLAFTMQIAILLAILCPDVRIHTKTKKKSCGSCGGCKK